MNPYFLYILVREHQAELLSEIYNTQSSQVAKTGKATATRQMLPIVPAFFLLLVLLVRFLG